MEQVAETSISPKVGIFERLLPQQIDNTYRGQRVALWIFGLVTVLRITQSVFIIFNSYTTVVNADGIPLDTFTPAAAQTVVSIFALNSVSRLIIALLCVVVLVRYRSAVSFMFALLVLNYLAGQLVTQFIPLPRVGTVPGPIVNLITFALTLVGLALSLWRRGDQKL